MPADMIVSPLVDFCVINIIGCVLPMYDGRYSYVALSCFIIIIDCVVPMYDGRYGYIAFSPIYNFINAFVIAKLWGHIYTKKKLQR